MKFAYTAYTREGIVEKGRIDADSRDSAEQLLRERGLLVQTLDPESNDSEQGSRADDGVKIRKGGPRNVKQLSHLLRQLSILLSSGSTLADSLEAVSKQIANPEWRAVMNEVRTRVEEGEPLAEALGAFPKTFDAPTRSLVLAGESSGRLTEILARLSEIKRRQHKARSAISGAMIYPVLLIVASLTVLGVMMTVVLPRFAGMFESIDAELPATTRLLMDASDLVRAEWPWFLGGVIAIVSGSVVWLRSPSGKRTIDLASLHAPILGSVRRSFATANLARLLGMLLQSRVQLLESLELTSASMASPAYSELLDSAADAASKGESISSVFARSSLVPGSLVEAMKSGERSGSLGPVLSNVATFLDEDNEVTLRSLSSLVEPLILIVLGSLVAFIAVSMFLPLFDLTASAPGVSP